MEKNTLEELHQKLLVKKKYIETIIDSINTGIFTVGPKGYLKTINYTASQILGLGRRDIVGLKASKIITGWDDIQQGVNKKNAYLEEETFINGRKGKIHCILSVYPIIENRNYQYEGVVCTFNEIKNVINLANKVMGKDAFYTFDKIIGQNKDFIRLIEYAKGISKSSSTVLITGESGTGKELFAQSIHNESQRRKGPFVAINCGAIPKDLIESELFGYEEGAFTGAVKGGRAGKFELADGGTLFLDEIGEMPIDMQTNLLRVLESGTLFRIGGNREIKVDVRIIAATNRDLKKHIEEGQFRKDLFYRLNVLPLNLMPLRRRKDDIPILIDYFIKIKSLKLGKPPVVLPDELMEKAINYPWPGNVRELENMIERIINSPNTNLWKIMEDREGREDCKKEVVGGDESLEAVERDHIEKIIRKYDGNITYAAEVLGIGRNTLYRKMKKYQITAPK